MTRERHPYLHEDISLLAKSLRKQLANRDQPPGHLEFLNMLARAAGQENYQSWLAIQMPDTNTSNAENAQSARAQLLQDDAEIVFRICRDGPHREVFARDSSGRVLDRRHESVPRVLAHFDVGLRIAGAPEGVVRFRASAKTDLLPPGEQPERWLLPYLPRAIERLVATLPGRISIFGTLDLPLDAAIAEGLALPISEYTKDVTVSVATSHRDRLANECEHAEKCSQGFLAIKDLLWEIFGIPSPSSAAQSHRTPMAEIAQYLRDYLAAEGDMFMGAWNEEKIGRAARLLQRAAANPRTVNKNDWKWARQDVYVATPPKHWDRPVLPPTTLFVATHLSSETKVEDVRLREVEANVSTAS